MTRGMYAAAGGMLIGQSRHEVLSNNLANVNTPGFKGDRVTFGSYQKVLLPGVLDEAGRPAAIQQSATLNDSVVDLRAGVLVETGNRLDLGIENDGWFVVQTPTGEQYTRNGHFQRAPDGTLVTAQGHPVLGLNGPIQLASDEVDIDESGVVHSGGQPLDQLRLVAFSDPRTIVKGSDSLYGGGNPVPTTAGRIRQGRLEQSNTDTMRNMVEMIATMRSYEMNQRIIQAQDQTIQSALEIARR